MKSHLLNVPKKIMINNNLSCSIIIFSKDEEQSISLMHKLFLKLQLTLVEPRLLAT